MKKAQSSLEVTILLGFMLLVFSVFLVISTTRLVEIQEAKDTKLITDLAYVITNEINIAFRMEEGYTRTFSLPESLKTKEYLINVECPEDLDYSVLVLEYQNHVIDSEFPFIIPKVMGGLTAGENTISKVNGVILLNGGQPDCS